MNSEKHYSQYTAILYFSRRCTMCILAGAAVSYHSKAGVIRWSNAVVPSDHPHMRRLVYSHRPTVPVVPLPHRRRCVIICTLPPLPNHPSCSGARHSISSEAVTKRGNRAGCPCPFATIRPVTLSVVSSSIPPLPLEVSPPSSLFYNPRVRPSLLPTLLAVALRWEES